MEEQKGKSIACYTEVDQSWEEEGDEGNSTFAAYWWGAIVRWMGPENPRVYAKYPIPEFGGVYCRQCPSSGRMSGTMVMPS